MSWTQRVKERTLLCVCFVCASLISSQIVAGARRVELFNRLLLLLLFNSSSSTSSTFSSTSASCCIKLACSITHAASTSVRCIKFTISTQTHNYSTFKQAQANNYNPFTPNTQKSVARALNKSKPFSPSQLFLLLLLLLFLLLLLLCFCKQIIKR